MDIQSGELSRVEKRRLAGLRDEIRAGLEVGAKMTVERLRAEYAAGQILLPHLRRGRPQKSSTRKILIGQLEELGIGQKERHVWSRLALIPEDEFEGMLATRLAMDPRRGNEISRAAFLKRSRELVPPSIPADSTTVKRPKTVCEIRRADVRDGLEFIGDGSVDAIVTDPPWHADADTLELFSTLGKVATRILKPGGLAVVMVGNTRAIGKLSALAETLDEFAIVAYHLQPSRHRFPTNGTMITFASTIPVGVFTNGRRKGLGLRDTYVRTEHAFDRTFHRHGQDLVGMRGLLELCTEPGQLVCDPFLGGGTTAAACVASGRMFIGSDTDTDAVRVSARRVGVKPVR